MKTFLKFPLYVAMATVMACNFSACSDDDNPSEEGTTMLEKDKTYKAIAEQFTSNTVNSTCCASLLPLPQRKSTHHW